MRKFTWNYVRSESRGYNLVGAFERTLMNFGLLKIEDECDADVCDAFADKWSLRIEEDADEEMGT